MRTKQCRGRTVSGNVPRIGFTAAGAVCFVAGVWLARRLTPATPAGAATVRKEFWLFCLVGGWFVTYALSFLGKVSSLGAAIDKGGAIWMLGVLLGLRAALQNAKLRMGAGLDRLSHGLSVPDVGARRLPQLWYSRR